MKTRVRFAEKPFPHTPSASGLQTYEGELEGQILWCTCAASNDAPQGRFGIHIVSRAVIIPLEANQERMGPKGKAA